MATPTLIQVLLGTLFAALGIFGFFVSIFPARTRKTGLAYFAAFALLTALGVTLLAWQAVLAERAQIAADKAADELRHRVDVLYRVQTTPNRRPTDDQVVQLQEHFERMHELALSKTPRDLALETRDLAAELDLFGADRARIAPERFLPPTGNGGWPKKNEAAIEHDRKTKLFFDLGYKQRLVKIVGLLLKAGVVDEGFAKYGVQADSDPLVIRRIARQLDEAAIRLPKSH